MLSASVQDAVRISGGDEETGYDEGMRRVTVPVVVYVVADVLVSRVVVAKRSSRRDGLKDTVLSLSSSFGYMACSISSSALKRAVASSSASSIMLFCCCCSWY